MCVFVYICKKKAKLSCIFFGLNFLKEMNVKMVQLNSHFFNKMSVCGSVCRFETKQPNWVASFLGSIFLKEMDFKIMQLNSHFFNKMSVCVCVCVCVCVDLNKKPNWVAPFLGWSFLKEMSLKMMQLNSKWSQSTKSQIELHLFQVACF